MRDYFNNIGFNMMYLNSSKYARKQELLNAFYSAWYDKVRMGLKAIPIGIARGNWKDPEVKKFIKVRLKGLGHTDAAITGIFKVFKTQLDYN